MTDISKEAVERTYIWNGVSSPISKPQVSDIELAGMVRMLMRDQLNHEVICTAARDRIMCLYLEKEALSSRVEELEAENSKYAEHLLCLGVPKFGPASGPSGLNDEGFRVIGSDAAIQHFKGLYERRRLQGLDEAIAACDERDDLYKDDPQDRNYRICRDELERTKRDIEALKEEQGQ